MGVCGCVWVCVGVCVCVCVCLHVCVTQLSLVPRHSMQTGHNVMYIIPRLHSLLTPIIIDPSHGQNYI